MAEELDHERAIEPRQITLRSYAKINLGLQVVGKRDDSFHEIRTVYQTVDLHDCLQIQLSSGAEIEFDSNHEALRWSDNLVVRAARALNNLLQTQQGCQIYLEKRIPLGSGLGGGSSNAAATILGMKKLLRLDLSTRQMLEMGEALGSDVPFFFVGGTALGVGRGSEVYPLEELAQRHVLLVIPEHGVSTQDAYARLRLPLTKQDRKSIMPVFCSGYLDSLAHNQFLENDFETVVFHDFPDLKRIKNELRGLGASRAGLTGSGSALFGIFSDPGEMWKAKERIASDSLQLIETETLRREQYWNCLVESLQ
jgi:4-diphosphocytidyl-2-C-methyl-D-erythritol kinase